MSDDWFDPVEAEAEAKMYEEFQAAEEAYLRDHPEPVNGRCPKCGSSVMDVETGPYGWSGRTDIYLVCEDDCGWSFDTGQHGSVL